MDPQLERDSDRTMETDSGEIEMASPFDRVPDEVISFIFGYLSPYGDLKAAAKTCQRWHTLANNVASDTTSQLVKAIHNNRYQDCQFLQSS